MQIKLTECENDVIQLGFENVNSLVITTPTSDKYTCEICKFTCSKKSDWERHTERLKHTTNVQIYENDD